MQELFGSDVGEESFVRVCVCEGTLGVRGGLGGGSEDEA